MRTDHAALKSMQSLKISGAFVIRLLDTLSQFNFDVHHRPGTQHGNADALSRATHHPEIAIEETPKFDTAGLATVGRPSVDESCASEESEMEPNYEQRASKSIPRTSNYDPHRTSLVLSKTNTMDSL